MQAFSFHAIVYEMQLPKFFPKEFLSVLPPCEREELVRLPEHKRTGVLCARLLLRMLLLERAHLSEKELLFLRDRYAKPYLPARPDLCFNLSHTDNAAAAALFSKPVGVDVQSIRPISDALLARFFSEEEQKYCSSRDARQRIAVWTKKEAYSKMIGRGLSLPFPTFSTLSPEISDKITTFARENYFLSVCTKAPASVLAEQKDAQMLARCFSPENLPKKD